MNTTSEPSRSIKTHEYEVNWTYLAKHVLRESAVEFTTELSDKTLLKLYNVFGGAFERGLELYELGHITHVSASETANVGISKEKADARWLLQVKGLSGKVYTLFPDINFCTCAAFRSQVLNDQIAFTCKHILAAWLSSLDTTKLTYKRIMPAQFRDLLLHQVSYK